jgi:hypothetical protein
MKRQKIEKSLQKDDNLPASKKIILAICGAIIGFVNGFFGGGGGMICVPLLQKVLHLPQKYSHATAIVIILPISFFSAVIYCLCGHLEFVPFATVTVGVVLGGILGAFALKFLPEKVIKIVFAALMLAGGIRLLI